MTHGRQGTKLLAGLLLLLPVSAHAFENDDRCELTGCLSEPACTNAADPQGATKFCTNLLDDPDGDGTRTQQCDCVYQGCSGFEKVPRLEMSLTQAGGPLPGPWYGTGKVWSLSLADTIGADAEYSNLQHEDLPDPTSATATIVMDGPIGSTGLIGFHFTSASAIMASFPSVAVESSQTGTNGFSLVSGSGTVNPTSGALVASFAVDLTNSYLSETDPMRVLFDLTGTVNSATRRLNVTFAATGYIAVP